MKRLIIFICCTLSVPTPAIAGVSNIRQMTRNSNGNFDVTCLNGSLEKVGSTAIIDDSVCKTETDKPFLANSSVVCTGSTNFASVIRISDGKELGRGVSLLSLKDCQESTRAANNSVVCIGSTNFASVIRISDDKELGRGVSLLSLKDCQESTRAANNSVVCIGSTNFASVTRISDEKVFGSNLSLKDCQESTRASRMPVLGWVKEWN
jgi:hypothetical protein